MVIVSNLSLPRHWECGGIKGESIVAFSAWEILRKIPTCDVIVVNGNDATLKVCALLFLMPFLRRPIIAVDLVLREPEGLLGKLKCMFIKRLFRQVSLFVHYFADLSGYARCFGIGEERSVYVPFKPNLRNRFSADPDPNGEYVLCFGQSMRDYKTFFEAVASLPCYPAAISKVNMDWLHKHKSRLPRPFPKIPANVRVLDDDGSQAAVLRIVKDAKLVVIPILRSSLCASGIGTYLDSMLLGKCVIISATPGAADLLTDQALLVPPENPQALAQAIQQAWENTKLRTRTAAAGHSYAINLGGEADLHERVLRQAVSWLMRAGRLNTKSTSSKSNSHRAGLKIPPSPKLPEPKDNTGKNGSEFPIA